MFKVRALQTCRSRSLTGRIIGSGHINNVASVAGVSSCVLARLASCIPRALVAHPTSRVPSRHSCPRPRHTSRVPGSHVARPTSRPRPGVPPRATSRTPTSPHQASRPVFGVVPHPSCLRRASHVPRRPHPALYAKDCACVSFVAPRAACRTYVVAGNSILALAAGPVRGRGRHAVCTTIRTLT